MKDYVAEAKKIIEENIYLTVATSDGSKPWISPLFFAYDQNYNFYWVSGKDALHSKLIRSNPQVAIVIFDSRAPEGDGDGVYFEATCVELTSEEDISKAMAVLNKRITRDEYKIKDVGGVTGEGLWRIYKATPQKTYKLSETVINGQYIDKRVEITL